MHTESFRRRLKQGVPLIGTLVTLPVVEVAEILIGAGFDWLFVDLEHSPLDVRDAQAILQAVDREVDCILRVPLNDEVWIKKALDTGAAGIIVPQVNSAEEARRAVRFSKYPPQGMRSVGLARVHGYEPRLGEYVARANAETAVIVQVEHTAAVQNAAEIAAVVGVDALLVGPYDLSASMGKIGQVEDAEVQAAVERVRRVCLEVEMPLGIYTVSPEVARRYVEQGYRLVVVSSDMLMLARAAGEVVRGVKGG
ncbi:MAG TPA: aldolase/citrate lyase family protein [Anaerolineaceae bacterium]|nr:aldolase/citrate lyase family protein [Anaerolineaceae bacterium]